MAITGYTSNLRLRLSDDLTADALYNLQRLDTVGVGGTSNLDAGQTVSGVFATARIPVIPLSLGGLGQSLTTSSGIPLLTSGVLSFLSVGTAANNLVQLDAGGALPAVSGANLTNLPLTSFSGVLPLLQGGTGVAAGSANAALAALSPQTTKGDILGFSTVPIRIPAGSDGQVLTAQASTSSGLTWTSPLTNPLTTEGDLIYGGTGGAANRLAADTSNTRRFLRTQSVGGSPSAPVWDSLQAGDIPTLNQNTTGTAANVTGVVAVANGGTGATSTTGARTGIGAAAAGANSDITSLTGLTTPLSVGQGGTGATTQAAALTALAGAQTAGHYLRSDGTNTSLAAIQASDVPVLNQDTTGKAANVTGVVAIANGGTGATTQAAALTALAGTQAAGKYLRSDGTNTTLAAIQAADVPTLNQNTTGTAANVTGLVAPANGGTGVANASGSTITLGGSLTTSGAFALTLTTTAATNVTLPTTGTLSTLAGVETLSGKTLTSPTLNTPIQGSYEDWTESTTPANPGSGKLRVYAKSDDSLYTLNASGVETQVGSGAGEKNYLGAASSTASGWAAVVGTGGTTNATVTISTDTAPTELPRPYTTKKGIKFVATAASGGTPVSAFGWTTFQLDPADYNKKLKLQFDQAPAAGYASGDYSVEVRAKSTAWTAPARTDGTLLPLSTDSSGATTLPNLEGTFRTTFDAPGSATPYIAVFVVPKTSATSTIVVSDVVAGPGVVTQGAAVSQWQAVPSYTQMTNAAITSPSVNVLQYRRVGDTAEFRGIWGGGTATVSNSNRVTWNMPSGMTIDTTKVASTSEQDLFGEAWWSTSAPVMTALTPQYSTSTTIVFKKQGAGNLIQSDLSTGAEFYFEFRVPIAEWAGSGTVNVSQNDVEYAASTTGTWDAAASAGNTVYGPGGAPISGALTASRVKVVQFQTPIQATDKVVLEYHIPGTNVWVDQAASNYPASQQQAVLFGGQTYTGSTNTVSVAFGQYATPGTTFNSNAGAGNWAATTHDAWRLRKIAGGQAVGFGIVVPGTSAGLVSAAGVPGNTTGNAIASGYVGETVEASLTAVTLAGTSYGSNLGSLTVDAGVWMLILNTNINKTAANSGYAELRIHNSTDATDVVAGMTYYSGSTIGPIATPVAFMHPVVIGSTKTFTVDGYDPNGTGSIGAAWNSGGIGALNKLTAVRIA